jgi:hypothetical protein
VTAEGVADEDEPVELHALDEAFEISYVGVEAIVKRHGPLAVAMTSQIERVAVVVVWRDWQTWVQVCALSENPWSTFACIVFADSFTCRLLNQVQSCPDPRVARILRSSASALRRIE